MSTTAKARYNYAEILLSGRPAFFAEGLDYREPVDRFKKRWFDAAKRRGLKLATWTNFEPEGIILQAYLPTHQRPPRPDGPAFKISKATHPNLYCSAKSCDTRLSPREQKDRQCKAHLNQ